MKKTLIIIGALLLSLVVFLAIVLHDKDMTEQELIDEMQTILQNKMEKDYESENVKRDAHPKCLGLLTANFKVEKDLPKQFKVGIFQPDATYKALIRISNASARIQSDKEKDFRGFAIKLLGVEGKRFTNDEAHSQDFLLMSHPTMPLGTAKLFRDAVYYAVEWNPLLLVAKLVFSGNANILKELKNGKHNDTSPLDINYWSTTPYQFGNKQVKYKIVPTSATKSKLPEQLTDDYLTQNMYSHLSNDSASFDFYVQEFENEENTPIENAGVEWKTPFIKLATITIPIQNIDTPERFNLAEQLFFSPANALEVHKPIGGLNRARIQIYTFLSKFRHEKNGQKMIEPNANMLNNLIKK